MGKSLGNSVDPPALIERYGTDALRWWLLRDVPRAGDTDFREELLVTRANSELANGLGNLVNRTIALSRRYRPSGLGALKGPVPERGGAVLGGLEVLASEIDAGLADFDFRAATSALWAVVAECNRFVSAVRPWDLAKAELTGDKAAGQELDRILSLLVLACERVAHELEPFLPAGSVRILAVLGRADPAPRELFPKLEVDGSTTQAARSGSHI